MRVLLSVGRGAFNALGSDRSDNRCPGMAAEILSARTRAAAVAIAPLLRERAGRESLSQFTLLALGCRAESAEAIDEDRLEFLEGLPRHGRRVAARRHPFIGQRVQIAEPFPPQLQERSVKRCGDAECVRRFPRPPVSIPGSRIPTSRRPISTRGWSSKEER